ncbi:7923_t:CDS:2 [Paraglomus occultum]|uniref:7923_t:CDS:1 n=1 Tax=Paraglomus occultum TaxID=144539 RepID=A0A9N9C5E9_9GLOM|nr:7923_t:CDS:2 [Paraglomus occultum]
MEPSTRGIDATTAVSASLHFAYQSMQQEYVDGSNQYFLYQDFPNDSQNGLQLTRQYQSSSQLSTDVIIFGSLPTYSISQVTNQQQARAYIDDSNLPVREHLVTVVVAVPVFEVQTPSQFDDAVFTSIECYSRYAWSFSD